MSRKASITKAASSEKRDTKEETAYSGTINRIRTTILMETKWVRSSLCSLRDSALNTRDAIRFSSKVSWPSSLRLPYEQSKNAPAPQCSSMGDNPSTAMSSSSNPILSSTIIYSPLQLRLAIVLQMHEYWGGWHKSSNKGCNHCNT